MPKVNIFFNPGDDVPKDLQAVLNDYFSITDFEKLKKFGGRIQISITAPFTDRSVQNRQLIIDEGFINDLKSRTTEAGDILKNLTKDQLVAVAELLTFPITRKASTKEIKKALVDYINSEEKWGDISQS